MSVPNVECHLARAQLKRYIGGATLPEEVLGDLERHLHACPECLAEAQRMKDALLAGKEIDSPAASTSPMEKVKAMVAPFLAKLPGQKPSAPREGLITSPGTPLFKESRVNMRILATSAALALTLIAMSTILRDPTRLLGAKVPVPANTPPAVTEEQKDDSHEETATENPDHADTEEADDHSTEPTTDESTDEHAETENHDDKPNPDHTKPDAETHGTTPTTTGPAHSASGNGQSTGSASRPNSGLSLPGRPTMGDSPIITADGQSGVSGHAAPANPPRRPTTQPTPRRTTPARRRPSSSSTSNSSSTPRSPVTVYNPDGTKK